MQIYINIQILMRIMKFLLLIVDNSKILFSNSDLSMFSNIAYHFMCRRNHHGFSSWKKFRNVI